MEDLNMLTQFDEICQRKDGIIKNDFDLQRCIQRHKSPRSALKTRVSYHRDGYNKHYTRFAVAYAAEKTIDPEKLARRTMSGENQNFDRIS